MSKSDEQARKNIVNVLMHNKLPEKTTQEHLATFIHEQIGISADAPDNTPTDKKVLMYCLKKQLEHYEAELTDKDTLIETTHNNLIAALEENKRLRDMMEDMYKSWHNLYYSGDLSKNQLDEQADKRWKNFAKEYKVEP